MPAHCFPSNYAPLALAAAIVLAPHSLRAEETKLTGEQIYKTQCASCHGKAGEGVEDKYSDPLVGDRSVAELTTIIEKTMPEDAPEKCVGEDAKKVAAYIHDAFYSPLAQARNKPARIELSRLTVRQYQNAVSDLVGSFRPAEQWGDERGLRGEYYKGRRFRDRERVIQRTDPEVKFDFGEVGPDPEKFEPHEFSIRWEGSLLAPDTGDYDFIVQTEHAARLWINDMEQPLIDAWVKSGNDTEYIASIRLLGGRAYPVRLEFSKAKQGVDDSKKNKAKPPARKASIALLWKVPHRAKEVIPARHLSPQSFAERFVVQSPFPPDDRSIGYERGNSISKAWDQATTDGAIEVASYVAQKLDQLTRSSLDDDDKKAREFCVKFAEQAFRRPLTEEQRKLFIDRQFDECSDRSLAVKRVILLILKSPRFLYREVGGDSQNAYDVASRISFALWDSVPDQALLDAATKGELSTREQVAEQVARMLPDLRTKAKVREFLLQWLKMDQLHDLAKDPERFPGFDEQAAADLRTSLELFLDDVVWGEQSDFRQLLLSDSLYLNGRLAPLYGADLPPDAGFQKVALGEGQRVGILTHPYLMAGFAYTATSSPIHRGVFISRSLLGRSLRPPPEAVSPLPPELHADLTTRERIALQTKAQMCRTCHDMINPLGFTLENYDAIGRFRAEENGRPVDATGAYLTRKGDIAKFQGVKDLAGFLADSEETHTAFAEQLFHYLVKQPVRAYGPDQLPRLSQSFKDANFNIRKLITEIVVSSALPPTTVAAAAGE